MDHLAPMGGWGQSGLGLELGRGGDGRLDPAPGATEGDTMMDLIIRGGTGGGRHRGSGPSGRRRDPRTAGWSPWARSPRVPPGSSTPTGAWWHPGFVDLHTHYDAQLFWDPTASPSPLHGVTTVFGGNCGFSLAPAGPEHADYLTRMMARVEGMPLAALEAGLDWAWRSFGEWLARLDGSDRGQRRLPGRALHPAALGDGGGRRGTRGHRRPGDPHGGGPAPGPGRGGHGLLHLPGPDPQRRRRPAGPVPGRPAIGELERLAAAVADHPGTTIELIVPGCINGFSRRRGRPPDPHLAAVRPPGQLERAGGDGLQPGRAPATSWRRRRRRRRPGARVVALTLPHTMSLRLSFEHGAILDGLPGWREFFATPVDERIRALVRPRGPSGHGRAGPVRRGRGAAVPGRLGPAGHRRDASPPSTQQLEGRSVGDVAAEWGMDPWDALCRLIMADRLRTGFAVPIPESDADWKARAEVWRDPRAVVGGSDAGAHLDTMCGAVYSTSLLGDGVRKRQLLGVEEAVRLLTDVPARLYGLRRPRPADRGLVGRRGGVRPRARSVRVRCAPATTSRVGPAASTPSATGIEHVLVNGTEIVTADRLTGAVPGRVLRSGVDTETAALS